MLLGFCLRVFSLRGRRSQARYRWRAAKGLGVFAKSGAFGWNGENELQRVHGVIDIRLGRSLRSAMVKNGGFRGEGELNCVYCSH